MISSLLKVFILLTLLQLTSSKVKFFPFSKTHVRLTNVLGPRSSLTIHCQSKDDDLGVHVLPYNCSFEWSFHPNYLVLSTLFFCKIQWQAKLTSFDIYRESRDLYGCNKYCYWNVIPMGPCLLKHEGGYDFCYYWQKKKNVGLEQRNNGMDVP